MKKCAKCRELKPSDSSAFRRCSAKKDGLYNYCKACEKVLYLENRTSILTKAKDRYQTRSDEWRAERRERTKVHTSRQPATRRAREALYRDRDREKLRAYFRDYYARNIERERKRSQLHQNRRRAKKADTVSARMAVEDIDKLFTAQRGKCWWCGEKLKAYQLDHRIPVSKGGPTDPSNIVLACKPCNQKKGAKLPWEMADPRLL